MPQIEAPPKQEIEALLGDALPAWQQVVEYVNATYEMETLWSTGGKAAKYEYKFRRGGKTLCALYPKEGCFGFMVVLGRAEQQKFEDEAQAFDAATLQCYQDTKVYHDGRWLMLYVDGGNVATLLPDVQHLLQIKRRPNRKQG